MLVEFPEFTRELDELYQSTSKKILTTDIEIKSNSQHLRKLGLKINQTYLSYSREYQKNLLSSVEKKLSDLKDDHTVLKFAEKAEKLANTSTTRCSKQVSIEAKQLEILMQRYLNNNRPSYTNAKFIRFAKACIIKAQSKQPLLQKNKKENKVESISSHTPQRDVDIKLAENLYILATLLYQNKYKKALASFALFSIEERKEITFHIRECQGFLLLPENALKDQNNTISGILGYAHITADYILGTSPYPTKDEIHSLFTEMESL